MQPLAAPTAADAAADAVAATTVAIHVLSTPEVIALLQPPLLKRRRHAVGVAVPLQPLYSTSSDSCSRSRSHAPITLRPNQQSTPQHHITNMFQAEFPNIPAIQRPHPPWKPHPPHFHQLPHQEQIAWWLDFHATQLEAENKPQHAYVAKMLADIGYTIDDLADFRQLNHVKWNDTTNTYDTFSYHCNNIPSLQCTSTPAIQAPTATSPPFSNRAVSAQHPTF